MPKTERTVVRILISANHGHRIEIPNRHVGAGCARTYQIQGAALHTHALTITVAQFRALASGQPIVVTCAIGAGHTHQVVVQVDRA